MTKRFPISRRMSREMVGDDVVVDVDVVVEEDDEDEEEKSA